MKNIFKYRTESMMVDFFHQMRTLLSIGILVCSPGVSNALDLADAPLFSTVVVPGNLALALSVEFPTALSPAYPSTSNYSSSTTYIGYFDSEKCYQYVYNSTTPEQSYFTPNSYANSYNSTTKTSNHTCTTTTTTPLWSGNFLNWASMGALETFRSVLTGGYRATDTTTNTILQKSFNFNRVPAPNANGDKSLTTTTQVTGATPFTWTAATTKVWHQGIAMLITGTYTTTTNSTAASCATGSSNAGKCVNVGSQSSPNPPISSNGATYLDYNAQSSAASTANAAKVYKVYIRVKVCDNSVGVESNCTQYGTNYKPEGLMQQYAAKLRYSAFSYLDIPDYTATSWGRDGGVMRARMKFIGPTQPVPGSTPISNTAYEWDSSTGVMRDNPDASDATDTVTEFSLTASDIPNSGVMNYLNKFGMSINSTYGYPEYKTYDNVSELYYTILRYFKKLGNVSTYSSGTTAAYADKFPVITNWYKDSHDPIAYSCQKNFILGIGDVNTSWDGNLPNSSHTDSTPSVPASVTSDTSVGYKSASDYGIENATNMVGTLQGQTYNNKKYFIAGLAYDAHTVDMRSDLSGSQTVNTYWLDVWEFSTYTSKNQYWLAAKFGGFTVPSGFSPYATTNSSSTLSTSSWYTSADVVGSDSRPDNYFGAGQADTMKNGLQSAFKKIASEASTATATAISSPTPRQAASGNANYRVTYDPTNWTSTMLGQLVSYDSSGNPTYTTEWNATTLLNSRTSANRMIVTCCTNTGTALPFTDSSLSGATLDARTYYTSFGAITGVSSGSQSASNYLEYLRGTRTQELPTGPYRTRTNLLGDIVDSKLTAVGKPSSAYFDIYNPGYSTFKSTYINRPTVVYVGANDGMMHAFDGTVPTTTGGTCTSTLTVPSTACGKEIFAYIPSFTYGTSTSAATSGLASLGNPSSFSHHYLVNASPITADVDFYKTTSPTATSNDWRTILVGGLGKGGQGYYAIDITNPASFTTETAIASKVLWEFTHAHMGYSYGDAVIVKTPEFGWTIIVASGYNNDDGKGYFFFINPRTGALLKTVVTPDGSTTSPIDMAHIQAYVPNYQELLADALYAGDLQGNIWRVDLTPSTNTTTTGSVTTTAISYDYTIVKVATLTDGSGVVQPVSTKPLVEVDPNSGKRYVLVGTGQLLSDNDISSTQTQTFYGINDGTKVYGGFYNDTITSVAGTTTTTRSGTIPPTWNDDSLTSTPNVGVTFPVSRSHLVNNTNLITGITGSTDKPMGWYYNLSADATSGIAERVNVQPTATSDGIVGFAANLPNGDACSPAGTSRIFAVNFANGTSALFDSSGNPLTSVSLTSSVTDLSFANVQGTTRLYAGTGSGTVTKVGNAFQGATAYKRLNWREVPTAD